MIQQMEDPREYEMLVDSKNIPLLTRVKIRLSDLLSFGNIEAYLVDFGGKQLRYSFDFCKEHGYFTAYEQGSHFRSCPNCGNK